MYIQSTHLRTHVYRIHRLVLHTSHTASTERLPERVERQHNQTLLTAGGHGGPGSKHMWVQSVALYCPSMYVWMIDMCVRPRVCMACPGALLMCRPRLGILCWSCSHMASGLGASSRLPLSLGGPNDQHPAPVQHKGSLNAATSPRAASRLSQHGLCLPSVWSCLVSIERMNAHAELC